MPIGGAYASTQALPGKKRFVMGASGHIAGVINPPAQHKRSHWIRADAKLPKTHVQWLAGATEHQGSWWADWSDWLKSHAGKQIPANNPVLFRLHQNRLATSTQARARLLAPTSSGTDPIGLAR